MYIHSEFLNDQGLPFRDLAMHLNCELIELEPFAVANRKDGKSYPASVNGFYNWLNTILQTNDARTIIEDTDISIPMLYRILSDHRRREKLNLKSIAMIVTILDHFEDPKSNVNNA